MQSFDLLTQQIQAGFEAGMALGAFSVVIEMAVMALGKKCYAVDVARCRLAAKSLALKSLPTSRMAGPVWKSKCIWRRDMGDCFITILRSIYCRWFIELILRRG